MNLEQHLIPAADVFPCLKAFDALLRPDTPPETQANAYTTYTAFDITTFADWVNQYDVLNKATTIRFYNGIYTASFVEKYGLDEDRIGKIACFIWADVNQPVRGQDGPTNEDYFLNNGNTHP